MPRQFFVGGNFKLNPASRAQKQALVKILNDADIDPETGAPNGRGLYTIAYIYAEVVIAPPALYLIPLAETIRKDIKVAAQNSYIKNSGAFTGETRSVCLEGFAAEF